MSFACGVIQRAISLVLPGLTSRGSSLLQGGKRKEKEEKLKKREEGGEKSQTIIGRVLKGDGDEELRLRLRFC